MTEQAVLLSPIAREDGVLLSNLLELYIHDLSAIFTNVELGPQGRFGYAHLEAYLSESSDRFAFLIRCAERVAGFALVQRGSPAVEEPAVLDVAEFFVLRRFRGRGVGRVAAALLWDRLPGRWTVRAAAVNSDAVAFWRSAVAAYTGGTASECERRDGAKEWVVFAFDNSCG